MYGATSEPDIGSAASPEAPVTLEQAGSAMLAKIQQEALEMNVSSVKELKAIRFKKMVHVFNKMDPFRPLYRKVSKARKKRQWWATDAAFRNKMAEGRGCALVSKEVFDFVWRPETSDPIELPQGHNWTPSDTEVAEMTAVEIFAQLNPDTGASDVTGDSNIDEYNLRERITFDLVEYEGISRCFWSRGPKVRKSQKVSATRKMSQRSEPISAPRRQMERPSTQ